MPKKKYTAWQAMRPLIVMFVYPLAFLGVVAVIIWLARAVGVIS